MDIRLFSHFLKICCYLVYHSKGTSEKKYYLQETPFGLKFTIHIVDWVRNTQTSIILHVKLQH